MPEPATHFYAGQDGDVGVHVDEQAGRVSLAGLACPFNRPSHDQGGYVTTFAEGAFDAVLARSPDVVCCLGHDTNRVLGRTRAGTLRLWTSARGLHFRVELPDTPTGVEVRELVGRGDLTGCSTQYWVERARWDADYCKRTIEEVRHLLEVGPVAWPAFPDTEIFVSEPDEPPGGGMGCKS
jgi:HK97 family phage prohead protease